MKGRGFLLDWTEKMRPAFNVTAAFLEAYKDRLQAGEWFVVYRWRGSGWLVHGSIGQAPLGFWLPDSSAPEAGDFGNFARAILDFAFVARGMTQEELIAFRKKLNKKD